jgi:hypothetical protein
MQLPEQPQLQLFSSTDFAVEDKGKLVIAIVPKIGNALLATFLKKSLRDWRPSFLFSFSIFVVFKKDIIRLQR